MTPRSSISVPSRCNIPSREERHSWTPQHIHLGDANGREQADVRRLQLYSGRQGDVAGSDVLAGRAHIGAAQRQRVDLHAFFVGGDTFLHDHGVGALGHRRPGHDAHAFTWAHPAVERPAGQRGADEPQLQWRRIREVGAAQGVTVHRGVVMRRHVDRRADIACQHSSKCLPDRQPFRIGDR
jgi:hypothetical protein